jgi:tetratricopeptide (TPR) repeat protein
MRLSSISRALALTAFLVTAFQPFQANAQTIGAAPQRFVDIIELTDHDDQADVSIVFTCSVRYVSHLPISEGRELRIELRPQADCNVNSSAQIAGELPPVSGGEKIIASARVDSVVPGQLSLVLSWRKDERFVIAQGVDPRGLRVRLVDRARGRGKVILNEATDMASNFAVNLESQPTKFDAASIELAHQRLKAPAYVSEAVVDGDKWFRLRVGPIVKRADADALLAAALNFYPRAWLAMGDDVLTNDPNGVAEEGALPAVERAGSDPAADAATLAKTLTQARASLASRNYANAITLLTKLQRQPEFAERSQAQELLGLARERAGQFAHAKAEYEAYLRQYPHGDAAERVASRLRVMRAASARRRGTGQGAPQDQGWQFSGGVAQLARYDGARVDNTFAATVPTPGANVPTSAQTQQSALFTDVDFLARRRGERFDILGRLSAGYARNFGDASGSSPDSKRVSVASIEIADRSLGLLARAGRQTRNGNGVLGTFDGLFLSYQFRPAWDITATLGYPVERTDTTVQTERRFQTISLSYTPLGAHWDASVFGTTQTFDGANDRRAVGIEARYLVSSLSLVALIDYDTLFKSLNAASLLGTLQLPGRWNLSVDLEKRNSPVLTLRNALIGQPVTTLAELGQTLTPAEIFELAKDRTPVTSNYSITASRPIGERFQFSTTVSSSETAATIASGGVDAQPSSGRNLTYQTQIYGSSLWRRGDFNVLSLAYATTESTKLASLGITSRFPLNGTWRIGPRLAVDQRRLISDDSKEIILVPSLLLDYQSGRRLLQFEAGGQLGKRDNSQQTQNTKRYYLSLAYRVSF